jgi:hypothetical protein
MIFYICAAFAVDESSEYRWLESNGVKWLDPVLDYMNR